MKLNAVVAGLYCWICGMGGLAWAQGSLAPPGAPEAMMRSLEQIEPRTPIAQAGYEILQPGSYYLVTNLVATNHGVGIQASGVTLDLNGFTIAGDRGSVDFGIYIKGAADAPLTNVVVRNGVVRRFGYGVRAPYTVNCRLERLNIMSNFYSGVGWVGEGGSVEHCVITHNGEHGLYLNGTSAACNGNRISHCIVAHNESHGMYFYAQGSGGSCNGNLVQASVICDNGGSGLYLNGNLLGPCNANQVSDCVVMGNQSYAVVLYAEGSGQCEGNQIAQTTICGNFSYGVRFWSNGGLCNGNVLRDCVIADNTNYGVYLYDNGGQCSGNRVSDCVLHNNGSRAIHGNTVDGNLFERNHVTGANEVTTYGIDLNNSHTNLVLNNSVVGFTENYRLAAANTWGPIVTNTGVLPTTGAAMSAWANFSR